MPRKLDDIDIQILRNLQEDGRMTNAELATRADISPPPCLRRVRALEESGYIKGYHADLNAEALGYSVLVYLQVKIDSHLENELHKFEDLIAEWDMVRECYLLVGDYDYLLKVVAKDWESYQDFLTHTVMATPHVSQVKSGLAIRCAKSVPGVPVGK